MKKALRKRENQIKLLVVFGVLTVLAVVFYILFGIYGGILDSQKTADRYRGDNEQRFAQLTAFFPVGDGTDRQGVFEFQQKLDTALTEASLEVPENGSLYIDAYSATGQLTVIGEKASADVKVIGVGGDFFQFHPLVLRSGSYFSGSDLMQDRVILDEELAWRLFGGVELEGMTVTINNTPFVIAGVVSREDDFASSKAYTDGAGLFMSYDALNAISETKISCYELVCANPVDGFASEILKTGFSAAEIVENSSRFSTGSIFKLIRDFGTRSTKATAVSYPYWENAARIVEDKLAVFLFLAVLFSVLPAVMLITAVYLLIRHAWRKFKRWLPDYLERRSEERYERKNASKGER